MEKLLFGIADKLIDEINIREPKGKKVRTKLYTYIKKNVCSQKMSKAEKSKRFKEAKDMMLLDMAFNSELREPGIKLIGVLEIGDVLLCGGGFMAADD